MIDHPKNVDSSAQKAIEFGLLRVKYAEIKWIYEHWLLGLAHNVH